MNGEERTFFEERFVKVEEKLDKVHDVVLKLPCEVHKEKIKGIGVSLNRVWGWMYGLVVVFSLCGIGLLIIKSVIE